MEPLAFEQEALRRLPLAEAVLLLLRQATEPEHSLDLFDRLRERCYTRELTFDIFVDLIREALLKYGGSGRQSFEQARLDGFLEVSNVAAYGKLGCVPIALSEAFLAENTQRLLPLLPDDLPSPIPASLRRFRVLTVDGKVTKRVAKKLKVLRGLTGGALGGKGLAVLDMQAGLVIALVGCADGHANDCALVPALIETLEPLLGPDEECLVIADAQFADLTQPGRFQSLGQGRSHFLLRYSAKTHFTPDPAARPAGAEGLLEGTDRRGRRWRQEWGWLGRPGNPKRMAVRRITLERPGEETVAVLTDLLDPVEFPAEDLLEGYLGRGKIEGVFQKITEVFSLKKLIACRPKGTVFQLAFCLLLYNLIQVVRSYVAAGQGLAVEDVSAEMLFVDVQKQLTALAEVVPPATVVELVPAAVAAATVVEIVSAAVPEVPATGAEEVPAVLAEVVAPATVVELVPAAVATVVPGTVAAVVPAVVAVVPAAVAEVVPVATVAEGGPGRQTQAQVRARLKMLLGGLWKPIWRKTVNKKRRAHPDKPRARGHSSVHRVLESSKHEKMSQLATSGP